MGIMTNFEEVDAELSCVARACRFQAELAMCEDAPVSDAVAEQGDEPETLA